jgi:hypothetical protein
MICNSEIIQFNKFAKFHNGKNVFFCKTDYLPELFTALRSYKVPSILISGNSDYPITDELVSKAPPCLKKWFSQCVNTDHPMMCGLPYGIDNHEDYIMDGICHGAGWPHAKEKLSLLSNSPNRHPHKEVYANFSLHTHPIRQEVYEICESSPHVTVKISKDHEEANSKPYVKYLMDIVDHKMVACPRGNAPAETHRFWETLYMNRVPIIKKNKGNSFFTELPVIVLEDWEQLANLEFLESEWEKVKDNSREMLKMSYWEELILNECR